jgi:hypothetical protein
MSSRRSSVFIRLAGLGILGLFVLTTAQPLDGFVNACANHAPIAIPAEGTSGAAHPYPSATSCFVNVGVVRSISVTINDFSHSFPDNVDIVLVGPTGLAVVLMSDVGGGTAVSAIDITFSDTAAAPLPDSGPLASGTYRPTNLGTGDTFPFPGPVSYENPEPVGAATLSGTFAGTGTAGEWKLFVMDDGLLNLGQIADGWSMLIVSGPPVLDQDTDKITDWTVVRGTGGGAVTWFVQSAQGFSAVPWGTTSDAFLSGDYDGDLKSDLAVWRPLAGTFFVRLSSNGLLLPQAWGLPTDEARVAGDYDGDAKTDFAVWRPSNGTWYIRRSSNAEMIAQPWGLAGDLVALGNYDWDGRADFAVRRGQSGVGVFHILQSYDGYVAVPWGLFTDSSVPGDYDGDGRTDIAVVRNISGSWVWFVRRSTNGSLLAMQFGAAGTDKPVPGDYDGDGKTDIAVWRSADGTFYVWLSYFGFLRAHQFGQNFDYPVANFLVQPQ